MRIAFDGTTLTAGRTGVGYYTEHLLQHLATEVEKTGDELIVRRADACLRLMRPTTRSYYQVLRTKLKWGER